MANAQRIKLANPECPRGRFPPDCLPEHLERLLDPLSRGLSNQQMADGLCLSPKTVRNYVSELMQECGCENRGRLILRAVACLALQENKDTCPWDRGGRGAYGHDGVRHLQPGDRICFDTASPYIGRHGPLSALLRLLCSAHL